METIHPIILISLPGVGEEMVGGVLDKLSVSHNQHSRFFRHVSVSETGVLSCNLKDDLHLFVISSGHLECLFCAKF